MDDVTRMREKDPAHRARSIVRVLLVSGHPDEGVALAECLTRHGFEVVSRVASPQAAADAARALRPDVALVDGDVAPGWRPVVAALEAELCGSRIAVLASYWSRAACRDATASGVGATLLRDASGPRLAGSLRALSS